VIDSRSERNLAGVHPALVALAAVALRELECNGGGLSFIVTEGLRTRERQAQLFKAGATRTMESKHLLGRAIDIVPVLNGQVHFDWPLHDRVALAMKDMARMLGVNIVWGGDWSFKDGPHFELADNTYT
jgi:peptidoglycan L-alanyl-D-glutamate endopeptidase CwlK